MMDMLLTLLIWLKQLLACGEFVRWFVGREILDVRFDAGDFGITLCTG